MTARACEEKVDSQTTRSAAPVDAPAGTAQRQEHIPQRLLEEFRAYLPDKIAGLCRHAQDEYLKAAIRQLQREQHAEAEAELEAKAFREAHMRYEPKHPHVYTFTPSIMHPSLRRALKEPTKVWERPILAAVAPHVFSAPCLQQSFCEQLLEEIDHFQQWCERENVPIPRPNSMNNHGVILDLMGLRSFLDGLMQAVACPLASVLYPHHGGRSLDSHHGYLVEYGPNKDERLDFHVDDSEVTLNICLGRHFQGGRLYMRGVRCPLHQQTPDVGLDEVVTVDHEVGSMLLHLGCHRHGAEPLEAGSRSNLILWCRSSSHRRNVDYRTCPGAPSCEFFSRAGGGRGGTDNACGGDGGRGGGGVGGPSVDERGG